MPHPPPRPTVSSSVSVKLSPWRAGGSRMRRRPGPRPLAGFARAATRTRARRSAAPRAARDRRGRPHLLHDHAHHPEQEQVEECEEAELQDGEDGLGHYEASKRITVAPTEISSPSWSTRSLTAVPFTERAVHRSEVGDDEAVGGGADLGVAPRGPGVGQAAPCSRSSGPARWCARRGRPGGRRAAPATPRGRRHPRRSRPPRRSHRS